MRKRFTAVIRKIATFVKQRAGHCDNDKSGGGCGHCS